MHDAQLIYDACRGEWACDIAIATTALPGIDEGDVVICGCDADEPWIDAMCIEEAADRLSVPNARFESLGEIAQAVAEGKGPFDLSARFLDHPGFGDVVGRIAGVLVK